MAPRHGLVRAPSVQGRWNDHSPSRRSPGNGKLDVRRRRSREFRPQERNRSRDKGSRGTRAAECHWATICAEAHDVLSGRQNATLADGGPEIGIVEWASLPPRGGNREHPGMAGDAGAPDERLVSRRRDHDHAAGRGIVQRLLERELAFTGWVQRRHAQIDHERAGIHGIPDRRRKFGGSRRGQRTVADRRLGENGADKQCATGADGRCLGVTPGAQDPGDEGPMLACHAVQP